ncbi:MAG: hypothetical protein WCY76_10990, partial [Leucobacter sp.]
MTSTTTSLRFRSGPTALMEMAQMLMAQMLMAQMLTVWMQAVRSQRKRAPLLHRAARDPAASR